MTKPLDLDPIKALCAAATPGPWCLAARGGEQSHDAVWPIDLSAIRRIALIENTDLHSGDAHFIARSRLIVDALIAEVERLRADLDRALTDGAASHGRYLAADSDHRYQAEKAAKHWQDRCEAITERDDARLALAMARGEGWPEGWTKHPIASEWTSPDGKWCIGDGTLKWAMWKHYEDGGDVFQDRLCTVHPDALSALRAYQAKVTP